MPSVDHWRHELRTDWLDVIASTCNQRSMERFGMQSGLLGGKTNLPTCRAQHTGNACRRDIALANEHATQLIKKFQIIWDPSYRTHAKLRVYLGSTHTTPQPYTVHTALSYSKLFNDSIAHTLQTKCTQNKLPNMPAQKHSLHTAMNSQTNTHQLLKNSTLTNYMMPWIPT